jgi:hypothetical protein
MCPDCRLEVEVPTAPVMVVRSSPPPVQHATRDPMADIIAVGGLLMLASMAMGGGRHSGGRRCIICGRCIHNPTPFCYRCQPLLLG